MPRVIAHEEGCIPMPSKCGCRGEAWLRELVRAASEITEGLLATEHPAEPDTLRLAAALQHFREEEK